MDINQEIDKYRLKCSLLGIEPVQIYKKGEVIIAKLYNSKVTECIIPNFVTVIDEFSFANCRELVSISLPKSLIEIRTGAFSYCNSLKEITIPNNVRLIEEDAFQMCADLEHISIESEDITIRNLAFFACRNLTTIKITGGNISIGGRAFHSCELKEVYIDCDNLKLGSGAFEKCSKLIVPKRFKNTLIGYDRILELY